MGLMNTEEKLELTHALKIRSYPGSPMGGDTGVFLVCDDGALVALIDATGHGLGAYAVAQKARALIVQHKELEPDALLHLLDHHLRGSQGAAASIARIRGDRLTFAGIGNVAARIDSTHLITQTGIIGCRMRTPPVQHLPFTHDSWLLMHTDGISTPAGIPPGSASTVVKTLIDTHGSHSDDASAMVVRWQQKV